MKQDGRVGLAVELLERGSGERLVHGHVPAAPRFMELWAEVWRGAEAPQVMLQEPESRVGDHVVEAVIRRRVVSDQAQTIGGAVGRLLVERLAALGRHRPVLIAHRARHPGDVVVGE